MEYHNTIVSLYYIMKLIVIYFDDLTQIITPEKANIIFKGTLFYLFIK